VRLAGKCLFTPQNWVFGHFDPLHGKQYQCNNQKVHPCMETRRMTDDV